MRRLLAALPYPLLLGAAVLLGLAPFVPQPHLLEKLQLLWHGELSRAIDIFDLSFHLAPTALLIAKAGMQRFPAPPKESSDQAAP
jgi:hypothetical protein